MAALAVARNHFLPSRSRYRHVRAKVSEWRAISGPTSTLLPLLDGVPFKEKHLTLGASIAGVADQQGHGSAMRNRSLHTFAVQFFIHFALESLVKSITFPPAQPGQPASQRTCVFYIVSRIPFSVLCSFPFYRACLYIFLMVLVGSAWNGCASDAAYSNIT